jgi:uncharacterized membrane-anchored protein
MMSIRQKIRDAVATALTDLPTTGKHVYVSRVQVLEQAHLPALTIFTSSDEVNRDLSTKDTLFSALQLTVRVSVKQTGEVDALLDQIEGEVRLALDQQSTLEGLVRQIQWVKTDFTFDGLGEQPLGIADMQFRVDYTIPA